MIEDVRAREAAANNLPPLAMEVPEPLATQRPHLGNSPREEQVAAETAPVEEEPIDPANIFEVETPVRDEEMDNATEEQDVLSLHSTMLPLTASPQNEHEEQSQESQASQDQSVPAEDAAKIPPGIAAEDWNSVRREIEAYEPYSEDELSLIHI